MMAKTQGQVLVVEDDEDLASDIVTVLTRDGWECEHASNGKEGLARVQAHQPDVVLTDVRMPVMGGLDLLRALKSKSQNPPAIILMTAHNSMKLAIESMRQGAFDYVVKPFQMSELRAVIASAIQTARINKRSVNLAPDESNDDQDTIIGESRQMCELFKDIGRVAATSMPVLIQGETGTGKELVARALFSHSKRHENPFIAVNCAAVPENLIESELFGHEKGAFTHAGRQRIGRFEQADGGTLFLDEIAELPFDAQAKLLRVLQEGKVSRVGGNRDVSVDVRLLSATNKDLVDEIKAKRFRDDLYYRIHKVSLHLPPLREREGDVILLAQHFIRRAIRELGAEFRAGVSKSALKPLLSYPWPGNVRELETLISRLILTARGRAVRRPDVERELGKLGSVQMQTSTRPGKELLASWVATALAQGSENAFHKTLIVAFEIELLNQALELSNQNQSQAARLIGMPRATFLRKLEHFLPSSRN